VIFAGPLALGEPVLNLQRVIGSHLLARCKAVLRVQMVGPHLLAFGDASLCALHALRPGLLALGSHLHALRPLRPLGGSKALLALHSRPCKRPALHSRRRKRLPLHSRGSKAAAASAAFECLRTLWAAATTSHEGRLAAMAAAAAAVRPRIRRGCDRQRGNTCCE
jgi:hypothetical protein